MLCGAAASRIVMFDACFSGVSGFCCSEACVQTDLHTGTAIRSLLIGIRDVTHVAAADAVLAIERGGALQW
jgi:hypothetical protein